MTSSSWRYITEGRYYTAEVLSSVGGLGFINLFKGVVLSILCSYSMNVFSLVVASMPLRIGGMVDFGVED